MFKSVTKACVEGRMLASLPGMIRKVPKKIGKKCTAFRKKVDKALSLPAIWHLAKNTPVEDNKIFFMTFRGEFDCNAKWIALELKRRRLPYTVVWTVRKGVPTEDIPASFIQVRRGSYEFYKHLASSKIIVDNGISTYFLGYKKKKNQVLIETWHGSLGIKMFSKETNKDKKWVMLATLEGKNTDYCLSNSTFEDAVFTDTFWDKSRILQLGHARNDILCEKDTQRLADIRKKVYTHFDLPEDVHICLYAPTFRDDGDMRPYRVDYEALKNALTTRFGGEWVILTRFHFRLLKKLKNYAPGEGVINASQYSDIQELLTCTDVGITDYSSWICDYMLTRRPGFLFATDMNQYQKKDREFFYPLDSMPFPLATDNEQLIENILNFDSESFPGKCDAFLADKGCMDDGHASERIADVIERIMRGEKV